MDADEMVREERVREDASDGGHVAADTPLGGVDRAGRPLRSLVRTGSPGARRPIAWTSRAGVARQTPGLVVGGGCVDVAMRVVAGHAVEGVVALSEAAAPGEGRTLKADRGGVVARDLLAARTMALGAD